MRWNNKIKNNFIYNISCALIIFIAFFSSIWFFNNRNSFGSGIVGKWDGVSVATNFSSGNGTLENPYIINSGAELMYFKSLIEGKDSDSFNTSYYSLGSDIDLDNKSFNSIGVENKLFKGTFNGNGHTINNILIDKGNVIDNKIYYGFFSKVEDANIINLNFNNLNIIAETNNKSVVLGSLVGEVNNNNNSSSINNISIVNSNIDITNLVSNDNMIGGISGFVSSNTEFYNIYIDVDIKGSYEENVAKIVHTMNSDSDYVICKFSVNNILENTTSNYVSIKGKLTNQFILDESKFINITDNNNEVLVDDLLFKLNDNLNTLYYWDYDNSLIIKIVEKKPLLKAPSKSFSLGSSNIPLHDSGVSGNTAYINDLESDYNYYMGLNYTDSTDKAAIPTGQNQNLYNDSNLAKVYVKYSGASINDSNAVGYVSLSEQISDFIYYKYYPVKDGYITFELIDNPYGDRPNNLAFNGWVTDYQGASIYTDTDIYVRYIKIPAPSDLSQPISININAIWIEATTTTLGDNGSFTTAMNGLKDKGFSIVIKTPVYENLNMTNFYVTGTVGMLTRYPSGALDANGKSLSGRCGSLLCTYYTKCTDPNWNSNTTYYRLNGTMQVYTRGIDHYIEDPELLSGSSSAGFYRKVTVNSGTPSAGYYDSNGNYLTGGSCGSSTCTYYQLINYYDSNGNQEIAQVTNDYYYMVTRDTNIIVMTGNNNGYLANTKPLTLTSINNGNDYRNSATYTISNSSIRAGNDLCIQYLNMTTSTNLATGEATITTNALSNEYIYGNWNNLKIGRGITNSTDNRTTAIGVISGNSSDTGSSGSLTRYRTIVESGKYNLLSGTTTGVAFGLFSDPTPDCYIDGVAVYGNDFDRISDNNDNLIIAYCSCGNWGANLYSSNANKVALLTIVKSGSFGTNKYDYTTGIYVGGRASGLRYGDNHAVRSSIIEGGWIYNLIGGPLAADDRKDVNDIVINIKGGEVDMVTGGAGNSKTTGNRIINMTGGTVNYSIFGGSNGYLGSNSDGVLDGSTLIYVGGNATVGGQSDELFGVESGSIFGGGNGNASYDTIGTVSNSYVIIDGSADIKKNVYGAGNYGPVGPQNSGTTKTNIDIFGGTIEGNVYGGGNRNGLGSTSVVGTLNISMTDGEVKGSIFGGSRTKGTIYGNVSVNAVGGTIYTDIYGGGEGGYSSNNDPGTYVTGNTFVHLGQNGDSIDKLTVKGNVYGGSAYGTVNGTARNTSTHSTYSTKVVVDNGTVLGSVVGGGKGSSTYTPYVLGDVTVTVNGGSIGRVYGGNDQAGSPNGNDEVHLNGGTIGMVFGGGRSTGQTTTNVYLDGATVTSKIFGGSDSAGNVTTSNILVTSGNAVNIYGGNNEGGTTATANVTVVGGTITGDIYGGGSRANTTTATVIIGSDNATIPVSVNNVYGGGESASVTTTSITINNATGGSIYGGSNTSGNVTTSTINFNDGNFKNIYGGNNQGGTTSDVVINVNNGTVGSVFGGGNAASTGKTIVNINNGNIGDVYGGGNSAGVTTTAVNIYGGTIDNVYGGSNSWGSVPNSDINIGREINHNSLETFINYDAEVAGSKSSNYATYVPITVNVKNNGTSTVSNWQVQVNVPNDSVIYSGSGISVNNGIVTISSNSLDAGETYSVDFAILTNTSYQDVSVSGNVSNPSASSNPNSSIVIGNVYGGNNQGGNTGNTNIDINYGTINNVYGGGNNATTPGNCYVDIDDATINNNVYGGGNDGAVAGNTQVFITNSKVLQSAYAGGNGSTATVAGNTTINIDGYSVIGTSSSVVPHSGCVFGSGNAAATGNNGNGNSSVSTVNIVGAKVYGNVYGGANTSIVYGKAYTNIGTEAVNNSNLIEGDVIILGTVFGGGEANDTGDEIFDWSFESVKSGIWVNIDGTDYLDNNHKFMLTGSIFGSGDASVSAGASEVYIKNLGTPDNPSRNISIQRADVATIDSSYIELSGIRDRTNEYVTNIKFSFSRIDKLIIKNGTTLLLKENANLLKELYSGVDVNNKLVPAVVTINEENKTVTKNVDNRIYMIPGQNLNITINENATAYGKVTGMTFFGMYNSYSSGTLSYGLYGRGVNYGDELDSGSLILGSSYVIGLHKTNHDIYSDGFYTNYLEEDETAVTVDYIHPSPEDAAHYIWNIGSGTTVYNISLNASKYSSLGTAEISMLDFAKGDITFNVIGFNSEGLVEGVSLVDSNSVPRIASTLAQANSTLGLSMKSETREWTDYNVTKFYSADDSCNGDVVYKTDSQTVAPSLMFYLYHAKNITRSEDLGTVVVTIQALIPKNEIEFEIKYITVNINIVSSDFQYEEAYDASITYDKKYEMPSATSVNITNQSQFTTYFSLFSSTESFEKFYGEDNDYYHDITSSYAFPVGTQITMIDYGADDTNPEYYYYTVTQADYNNKSAQVASGNQAVYRLSDFIKMDSNSPNNKYSDSVQAYKYYHEDPTSDWVMEEFLFIIDFKETTTTGTHENNTILFELRDFDDLPIISVLGIRQSLMTYNLYDSTNVVLNETVTPESSYLYYDIPATVNLETLVGYDQTDNKQSIINTNYESNSMGLNVTLFDSVGNQVSSNLLYGTSIKIDNVPYFADSDGVFRIKLSGKVANLNKNLYITTDESLKPVGDYTFRFTLFASADGRHNGHLLEAPSYDYVYTLVGSENLINVETDDKTKVVFGDTGLNANGDNFNTYRISYNSVLTRPNVRIAVYKRNIDTSSTNAYTLVDFNELFSNTFQTPTSYGYNGTSDRMLLINTGNSSVTLQLNDSITSGTYRLEFSLYDNNQLIDSDYQYVIVKKAVVDGDEDTDSGT